MAAVSSLGRTLETPSTTSARWHVDYVVLCEMWHLGDQEDSIMEKYRIGDLVYNMANIIDITLPGQHQDLCGQAISYNILANHLLSCRPCNHGHGTLKESNIYGPCRKYRPPHCPSPACMHQYCLICEQVFVKNHNWIWSWLPQIYDYNCNDVMLQCHESMNHTRPSWMKLGQRESLKL